MVMNNNGNQLQQEVRPLRYVSEVGRIPGPTKSNGQNTFCVVLGVFDEDGNQVVHRKADGTEVPLVITTYPIDTDEVPKPQLVTPKGTAIL